MSELESRDDLLKRLRMTVADRDLYRRLTILYKGERDEARAELAKARVMDHADECLEPWKCRSGGCTFLVDALRTEVERLKYVLGAEDREFAQAMQDQARAIREKGLFKTDARPISEELHKLIQQARLRPPPNQETIRQQRISWAYGEAKLAGLDVTREEIEEIERKMS